MIESEGNKRNGLLISMYQRNRHMTETQEVLATLSNVSELITIRFELSSV